nr:helix-turn-helix transcriptional regulator [Candidatus Freyarchaeota archaeon]
MKIAELEQTGAIRVLLYLKEEKKVKLSKIINDLRGNLSQDALYRAASTLEDLGLMLDEKTEKPVRRFFSITPKGELVVKKLEEIGEILEGE